MPQQTLIVTAIWFTDRRERYVVQYGFVADGLRTAAQYHHGDIVQMSAPENNRLLNCMHIYRY